MIKVGDKVIHISSRCIGTVILVNPDLGAYSIEVDFEIETDRHSDTASYTMDGKVWMDNVEPAIVPATKLHKIIYGIED